jgi:hypothetical protein
MLEILFSYTLPFILSQSAVSSQPCTASERSDNAGAWCAVMTGVPARQQQMIT